MADRVFVHIGLPKTGTTYLQRVLWDNRDLVRRDGVLLPGVGHREHLWAALDLQERKNLRRRNPRAAGAWSRLRDELAEATGTGLITHEFFCGASREQAEQLVADLAPAEVHVVVTARHAAGMLAAGWQEMVKNGGTARLDEIPHRTGAGSEFSWRTWDLRGVLKRWGDVVPPERVHVLPMPRKGEPADRHWRNFAGVIGLTSDYPLPERAANQSLGVVQVELLRRVNSELEGFRGPTDRGRWIRGYLAEEKLAGQPGEPFGLDDDLVADCRQRSERAVRLIRRRGYDVVGDLDALLVPDELPVQRLVSSVSDAELVDAAGNLVAVMLADVRELSGGTTSRRARRSTKTAPTS
ncbi:MAG: hypothetical protein JWN91_1003 [Nocardioides sp.]|nr:hypothetical protein [Nocardioides sp.]